MKNLFYSSGEKIAFFVAGYIDNSLLVEDIISMLKKYAKEFSEKIGVDQKTIKTDIIASSRRYKHMRFFYAVNIETAPKGAFIFTSEDGWTMDKWLHD